jgi:hypothetical protein
MNPNNRSEAAVIDGLYFRVSSNRQTTENQFADLLLIAEKDASERDWSEIRRLLTQGNIASGVDSKGFPAPCKACRPKPRLTSPARKHPRVHVVRRRRP